MTDRVVQSCDIAYEYGTYAKYVTVFRRTAAREWKIAADSFNTSLPPPGM